MQTTRSDSKVLGLAILIVGVFVVAYADWGVPLIGDSNRWAAAAIIVLALLAGVLSSPGAESRSYAMAGLVIASFLTAVLAFATASTGALALLVVALLALMAVSTGRHLRQAPSRTAAT
jgi:hypothetical protein